MYILGMDLLERRTHIFRDRLNSLPTRPKGSIVNIDPEPVIKLAEEFYKFAVATLNDNPVYDQLPEEEQIQIESNIITLDGMISYYVEQNICEQSDGHSEFENLGSDIASDVFLRTVKGHKEFEIVLDSINKATEDDPMRYEHIESFPKPKP
jgi:CHASE3 domain sensor protein